MQFEYQTMTSKNRVHVSSEDIRVDLKEPIIDPVWPDVTCGMLIYSKTPYSYPTSLSYCKGSATEI